MAVTDSIKDFQKMIQALPTFKKIIMGGIVVISIATISFLVHLSNKTDFTPLFTNLNADDVGSLVTQLDKQGVRYQVDADKKMILVPANQVLDLRMKMAALGLPQFGGVGFELFDSKGFGMSEFEQKLNYQRALQGELIRTIGELEEVEDCRVHLVIPEKSLFSSTEGEVRASVVLKLGNGGIAKSQVNSIVHLVASAVEGLDPTKATVVDTKGRLLSAGGDDETVASGKIFEQKKGVEKAIEQQVVGLLEPIVGVGKVVAKATVEVDFSRLEEEVEKVDPTEVVVLSESSSKRTATGTSESSGGVAGAAANLPGGAVAGSSAGGNSSNESSSSTNYDVTRITRKQIIPSGAIKKISMAVMVDGTYEEKDGAQVYTPRAQEEMTKLASIVKSAVGFNSDRGDVIQIENMAFKSMDNEFAAKSDTFWSKRDSYSSLISLIIDVLIVLAILAIILFVVRPLIKSWREKNEAVTGISGLPVIEGGGFDPERLRGEITKLIGSNPQQTANVIRQWIQN